jgi:hypothetical protein
MPQIPVAGTQQSSIYGKLFGHAIGGILDLPLL